MAGPCKMRSVWVAVGFGAVFMLLVLHSFATSASHNPSIESMAQNVERLNKELKRIQVKAADGERNLLSEIRMVHKDVDEIRDDVKKLHTAPKKETTPPPPSTPAPTLPPRFCAAPDDLPLPAKAEVTGKALWETLERHSFRCSSDSQCRESGKCVDGVCRCQVGIGGSECQVLWSSWVFNPDGEPFPENRTYSSTSPPDYGSDPDVPTPVLPDTDSLIVVDAGASFGRHTVNFAEQLSSRGRGGVVVPVDTWTGSVGKWLNGELSFKGGHPRLNEIFRENVLKSGKALHVAPFPSTQETVAAFFRFYRKPVDVVFLNPSLQPSEIFQAARAWWPALRKGGIMFGSLATPVSPQHRKVIEAISRACGSNLSEYREAKGGASFQWGVRKISDRARGACLEDPAPPLTAQHTTYDSTWGCKQDSDCNRGGRCSLGVCKCPLGRGGQRCEVGPELWLKGDAGWSSFPPPPKHREAGVGGWHGGVENFQDIFREKGVRTAFEVGVWKGMSTITMAHLIKKAGVGGVVVSIDPWLGALEHWRWGGPAWNQQMHISRGYTGLYEVFRNNVVSRHVEDVVLPFPAPGRVAAQFFAKHNVSADLVHIDGSHEYDDVIADLKDWWPIIRPGGVLYGDDYSWPGVAQAANEFAASVGGSLRVYGKGAEKGIEECKSCKWGIVKSESTGLVEKGRPIDTRFITFGT
eukprot:Sspe_Gene.42140::Locus_20447_Transcript_1_1_Confidence_1.000_Length_2226::g.42140::m.42140